MGCFFGCFRVRDGRRPPTHLVSESIPSTTKEPVESLTRNRLSSLLLFEAEEKDCSPWKDEKYHVLGSPLPDIDVKDLKDEAKFLKACGTLPQTPAEIRNAEKLKDLTHGEPDSSKFHSWLPNTTIQKLILSEQPVELPAPIKLCEEWVKGSCSSAHSPSSCITGQDTARIYTSSTEGCGVGNVSTTVNVHANQKQNSTALSVSPTPLVSSVQHRNKSVCFDCQSDASSFSSRSSSSEVANQNSKQSGSAGDHSMSKPSLYPTPLKLSVDMQTPGTVFPACLHNLEIGKNPGIRSQYVYSFLNPVENFSQLKALTEEDSNSDQRSDQLRQNLEQAGKGTNSSEVRIRGSLFDKESNMETSLFSWLKSKPTNEEGNTQHLMSTSRDFGKTPGDRPILGMVAAHWNEDEASRISPKWWDGNGIPNSTNKYKEDQKVNWHATPFEERLEKALSEENFLAERKHLGGTPLIDFDEKEEYDSGVSQMQPSGHFKPLVSF